MTTSIETFDLEVNLDITCIVVLDRDVELIYNVVDVV